MYFRFDPHSQVASLEMEDTPVTNVRARLFIALARMLGFGALNYRQPGLYVASKVVNLNNTNAIFIYSDVIDSQIVGDRLIPLLDINAVQGGPGDLVSSRFDKPHYKPVLRKHFSNIHISLRDDQGNPIRFEKGKDRDSAFEKSETIFLNSIPYHHRAHSHKTICVRHTVVIPRHTNATT